MSKALSRFFIGCLGLGLIVLSAASFADWHSDQQAIMGTDVSVTLWHDDPEQAKAAIRAVMAEMHRIDSVYSPYKSDSELSRLNRAAAAGPVEISAEFVRLLDKALFYSRLSEGAFDISFAALGRHYNYRQGAQPKAEAKLALLPAINYQDLVLDTEKQTLAFAQKHMQIDLGGIAKGYAVEQSVGILKRFGVVNATVSAGGDSRVIGDKRGKPWMIGVKNPRGDGGTALTVPLLDLAISTSGDYERFFIDPESGERIHHIINPATGTSAKGIASVSVIGPSGFDTDPLSTTVFVLGKSRGLALINTLPGFDCIIIDSGGELTYSQGLVPPDT